MSVFEIVPERIVAKLEHAIVLGIILLVASTNLITKRDPVSHPTEQGAAFIRFLVETGYLFHAVKVTEFVVAVLLLTGRFVALAIVLFAPILVDILLFHCFLQAAGKRSRISGRSPLRLFGVRVSRAVPGRGGAVVSMRLGHQNG